MFLKRRLASDKYLLPLAGYVDAACGVFHALTAEVVERSFGSLSCCYACDAGGEVFRVEQ